MFIVIFSIVTGLKTKKQKQQKIKKILLPKQITAIYEQRKQSLEPRSVLRKMNNLHSTVNCSCCICLVIKYVNSLS